MTICAKNREHLFGETRNGSMEPDDCGRTAEKWWKDIPNHFIGTEIDEYIVMPNHFHGIVWLVGAGFPRPGAATAPLPKLGKIIAYFKYQSTKNINIIRQTSGLPVWQRNYHERIIRNDAELFAIRGYIIENPLKWDVDPERW